MNLHFTRALHAVGQAAPPHHVDLTAATSSLAGWTTCPARATPSSCRATTTKATARCSRRSLAATASRPTWRPPRRGLGRQLPGVRPLVKAGDEVLVERPGYDPLMGRRSGSARVTRFERRYEDGCRLDPAAVERRLTPRTRLVVITNTHNPTGAWPATKSWRRWGAGRALRGPRAGGRGVPRLGAGRPEEDGRRARAGLHHHEQPDEELRAGGAALRVGVGSARDRRAGAPRARRRGWNGRLSRRAAVAAGVPAPRRAGRPSPRILGPNHAALARFLDAHLEMRAARGREHGLRACGARTTPTRSSSVSAATRHRRRAGPLLPGPGPLPYRVRGARGRAGGWPQPNPGKALETVVEAVDTVDSRRGSFTGQRACWPGPPNCLPPTAYRLLPTSPETRTPSWSSTSLARFENRRREVRAVHRVGEVAAAPGSAYCSRAGTARGALHQEFFRQPVLGRLANEQGDVLGHFSRPVNDRPRAVPEETSDGWGPWPGTSGYHSARTPTGFPAEFRANPPSVRTFPAGR